MQWQNEKEQHEKEWSIQHYTEDWRLRNTTSIKKKVVNSGVPEGYAVSAPVDTPTVLLLLDICDMWCVMNAKLRWSLFAFLHFAQCYLPVVNSPFVRIVMERVLFFVRFVLKPYWYAPFTFFIFPEHFLHTRLESNGIRI